MKNRNIFVVIGVLIFVIAYMINRFVLEISDTVYIVMLVIAAGSIILGLIDMRKKRGNKE